jgi:hypothetical protein
MKKSTLILVFSLIISSLFGQKIAPNTYLIHFKDKNNNGYSIDKPEEFLSQRAIERRQKYNIPLTVQDLPVNQEYVNKLKEIGLEIYTVSKWLNVAVVYTEDYTLIEKAKSFEFVLLEKEPVKKKKKTPGAKTGKKKKK